MNRRLLAAGAAFAVALTLLTASPDVARARPPQLQEGAGADLVLGTSGEIFGVQHFPDVAFDIWFGVRGGDDTNLLGASSAFLNPDLLIGLTLGNIVIGAYFGAGFYHFNPDGPLATDVNVGFLSILPTFEYWFDGEDMAPFIGLVFGPAVVFPDGGDAEAFLEGALRGGLAFFFGNSFSVAPTAAFQFHYDSSSERAGWGFVIGFDLRGWLGLSNSGSSGGDGALEPAPGPAPAPSPVPANPEAGFQ